MVTYNMQVFFDTSRRRIKESRRLLDIPKRSCDGATTCALLAAECALKATLLYGHQASTLDEIPEPIHRKVFKSKLGHDLGVLIFHQTANVKALWMDEQFNALTQLKQLDRFAHRYGLKRPQREHAALAVGNAEILVAWMAGIVVGEFIERVRGAHNE